MDSALLSEGRPPPLSLALLLQLPADLPLTGPLPCVHLRQANKQSAAVI